MKEEWELDRQRLKQAVDFPIAVAEGIQTDSCLVQQGEVQVCQWRWLVVANVPVALHAIGCTSCDDDWQVGVIVNVVIADAASVEQHYVVEQRAISFRRGLELLQILGEQRNVEGIDLRHALDFFRVVAMVRQRMMRIRDTDFRVATVAGLAGEL